MSSPYRNEINLVRCLKCGKIMKCCRYDTLALLTHIRNDHPEIDIIDTETKQKRTIAAELSQRSVKQNENSHGKPYSPNLSPIDLIENCVCSDEDCNAEKITKEQPVSCDNTEDEDKKGQTIREPLKDVDLTSEILKKYPEIQQCEYSPHNPNAQVIYTRRYRVRTPSPVSLSALNRPFQRNLYRTSIEKWRPANGIIHCPKCGCHKQPIIKTKNERFTANDWAGWCLLSCWPFCFLPCILPRQNQEYLYCPNCKTFLGLYDCSRNCIKPNRLYFAGDNDSKQKSERQVKKILEDVQQNEMLENESPPQSPTADSTKSKELSSIIIDGKELPPETVARIIKYKKFGSLVGLDLDALSKHTDSPNSTKRADNKRGNKEATSSMVKRNK